jgi:Carbohydrate binding module (family 6)
MQHQSDPPGRRRAGCLALATRRCELVRSVHKRPVVHNALSLVLGCALLGTTMVVTAGVRGEIVNVPCMSRPSAVDQTLQAEAAVRGGGVRVETNHNGHYGSGFVNFPHPPDTQGYIEWSNVDGGAGGEAILEIRHALVASTSRTVRLSVNGVEQLLTFAPTGNWSTWQLTPVHVTLHAGANNVVRLQANRQDSANIDELRVRFVTRGAL